MNRLSGIVGPSTSRCSSRAFVTVDPDMATFDRAGMENLLHAVPFQGKLRSLDFDVSL